MWVKDVKNIFVGLKKTCLGCFRIEKIRDKDNKTGLKEGGGKENANLQCFPIYVMHALFAINTYLSEVKVGFPCACNVLDRNSENRAVNSFSEKIQLDLLRTPGTATESDNPLSPMTLGRSL